MGTLLYYLIIQPLELVIEICFTFLSRIASVHLWLCIIGISIVVSVLTLPLYKRADQIQKKQRDLQKKLEPVVRHIKRTFKGDERFMILQEYYRQNHYSPLSALNGSLSLLLQIPFFIAAYHFLSHLEVLNGMSFGAIKDLSKPDNLLHFGKLSINLLPFLMTAVNIASAEIYLKGYSFREKFQTYALAIVFLVVLYNSPSALVFYWTLNNVFSLFKNIANRSDFLKKTLAIAFPIFALAAVAYLYNSGKLVPGGVFSIKRAVFCAGLICFSVLPLYFTFEKRNLPCNSERILQDKSSKYDFYIFLASSLAMTVLIGILVPSALINASPAEFVDTESFYNPNLYVFYSAAISFGFFMFWSGIFYSMGNAKFKNIVSRLFCVASVIILVDYLFFERNLGIINQYLIYQKEPVFSFKSKIINFTVLLAIALAVDFFCLKIDSSKKTAGYVVKVFSLIVAVELIMGIYNIVASQKQISEISRDGGKNKNFHNDEIEKIIPLSKNGKNVMLLMVDRAVSAYFPYFLEEKPELKEAFSGFTWYPNTISFGQYTNFGSAACYGGYEYSVEEMNKRSNEKLADKQDEALSVLPTLFSEIGYASTVFDPPYAGYKYYKADADLTLYEHLPLVTSLLTHQKYTRNYEMDFLKAFESTQMNKRNVFIYSLFRCSPVIFKTTLYDHGAYISSSNFMAVQYFIDAFAPVCYLPEMTEISDEQNGTFLMTHYMSAHDVVELQVPEYEPTFTSLQNKGYKNAAEGKLIFNEKTHYAHYQCNMATMLKLARYFDWLKEHGVYDNTRIIIVADHGARLNQVPELNFGISEKDSLFHADGVNPLFLVKDFGSSGEPKTDMTFMTNADAPLFAVKDLIENPKNPFTGKMLNDEQKHAHPQLITSSTNWNVIKNNGNVFDTRDGKWYSVHDNIFDRENWECLE